MQTFLPRHFCKVISTAEAAAEKTAENGSKDKENIILSSALCRNWGRGRNIISGKLRKETYIIFPPPQGEGAGPKEIWR